MNLGCSGVAGRNVLSGGMSGSRAYAREPLNKELRIMMKALLLLMTMLYFSGCAGLTSGRYPYPSGAGVVPEKKTMAQIDGGEFEAFQEVEGYTPDFALIGIVVPFIPFGQWKWLTGIGKEDLRITVNLWMKPKSSAVNFDASTLHVDVNGRTYSPSEVKMGPVCGGEKAATVVDLSKTVTIEKESCIWFRFSNLAPPDSSFTVVAAGLPPVTYALKRKTQYQFWSMGP